MFVTEFNTGVALPLVDECNTCTKLKLATEEANKTPKPSTAKTVGM